MTHVQIDEIIVENRVRKDLGDLTSLEQSIREIGLLQPIGITQDKHLIFGARRLQACKNLGFQAIPAREIDINAEDLIAVFRMEKDENDQRLDLTPSEKVEIARKIEESMAGRQGERTDLKHPPGLAEVADRKRRSISCRSPCENEDIAGYVGVQLWNGFVGGQWPDYGGI